MISAADVYWIARFPEIRLTLAALTFSGVSLAFVAGLFFVVSDGALRGAKRFALIAGCVAAVALVVRSFIPTLPEAAAMIALPAAASGDTARHCSPELTAIAGEWMRETLTAVKENKK